MDRGIHLAHPGSAPPPHTPAGWVRVNSEGGRPPFRLRHLRPLRPPCHLRYLAVRRSTPSPRRTTPSWHAGQLPGCAPPSCVAVQHSLEREPDSSHQKAPHSVLQALPAAIMGACSRLGDVGCERADAYGSGRWSCVQKRSGLGLAVGWGGEPWRCGAVGMGRSI